MKVDNCPTDRWNVGSMLARDIQHGVHIPVRELMERPVVLLVASVQSQKAGMSLDVDRSPRANLVCQFDLIIVAAFHQMLQGT